MAIPTYSSSIITAVAHVQQGLSVPQFIVGGRNSTLFELQKKDTAYSFNLWRSQRFVVGKPFKVNSIELQLSGAIAANMTITPVLVFDDGSTVVEGTVINSTNYTDSEKYMCLYADNFAFNVRGQKDFYFELRFSGTALVGVELPITIEIETESTL